MRVLRIDVGASRLELHPFVTVVRGLSPELHQSLLTTLAGVPRGSVRGIPDLDGILEAHGVFLDLTDDTLSLLELRSDLDVVVHAGDLPGAGATPGERTRRDAERRLRAAEEQRASTRARLERAEITSAAAAEALAAANAAASGGPAEAELRSLDAPRAELADLRRRRAEVESELERARAADREAVDALDLARSNLESARDDLATVSSAVTAAATALEQARARRDPFAASAVDAARTRLAELEAEAAADVATVSPTDPEPVVSVQAEIDRLRAQRSELEAARIALDFVDPYTVEVALAQVLAEVPAEPAPSPEAQALADEWRAIADRLVEITRPDAGSGASVADARRRLETARAAVFEAERAVRVPELGPGEGEVIEAAHQAVLDAAERAERRFAGTKAVERYEEARREEQQILDRLGFLTYSDFVMGSSNRVVDPASAKALEAARRELADAEAAWTKLERGTEIELERAQLIARQRELRDLAAKLSDAPVGDDVEWSLRSIRIAAPSSTAALDRLCIALERAGVVLDEDDLAKPFLVELATVWLAEQRDAAVEREAIDRELAAVDSELSASLQLVGVVDASPEHHGPAAVDLALVDARAALADAETRLARTAEVEAEVAASKAELERAVADEQAMVARIGEADAMLEEAQRSEHVAHVAVQALEVELSRVVSAEHEAALTLAALDQRLEDARARITGPDLAALEDEARTAADDLARARAAVEEADAEVGRLRAAHQALTDPPDPAPDAEPVGVADEIEWYLLARIAAQRSVSFAGSVPLVLDDALAGIEGAELERVLQRLERMSAAVQVILVTDDPAAAFWAEALGPDRAAAVSPERVPT